MCCSHSDDGVFFVFGEVGGLKLWEGSLDLIKALSSEVEKGHLSFAGKRVLEVDILIISGECTT